MKTLKFMAVLLLSFILLKAYGQSTTGATLYSPAYYLGWDGSGLGEPLPFYVAGNNLMNLTGNGDLDVTGVLNGGANGYQIASNYVLWNYLDQASIYVGENAGNGNFPFNTSVANTFWGYYTGNSTTTGSYNCFGGYGSGVNNLTGDSNVFIGNQCGLSNISGGVNVYIGNMAGFNSNADSNVFIGDQSGYWNSTGYENTFVGAYTGFANDTASANTFIGSFAGYSNTEGNWNTFTGRNCGWHNTTGYGNSFYGKHCGAYNDTGWRNSFFGNHAGFSNTGGDKNCSFGHNSMYYNVIGDSNVVIGADADYNGGGLGVSQKLGPHNLNVFIGDWAVQSLLAGDSNVFIGAMTDINNTNNRIFNSGAFGYGAIARNNHQIIMGNNKQFTGIGMSNDPIGPMSNLEIETHRNPTPPPLGVTGYIGNGMPLTTNYYGGTGFSGLKFNDLTSLSAPVLASSGNFNDTNNIYPTGVLSVDGFGNVIYVNPASLSPLGNCGSPLIPAVGNDPAIDLGTNGNNFWFEGNGIGSSLSNVLVGYNCGATPPAKLSVLQASGSNGTIGGYFENDDQGDCRNPVIGIKSIVPYNGGNPVIKVAGWFEAPPALTECCPEGPVTTNQYAILVPRAGGIVAIGAPITPIRCQFNPYLLTVYGSAYAYGTWTPSDSTLKTNVTPLSRNNNALSVIQKLNGVSFNYIDSVISDSGMGGTHYGFIAQQVARVLPNVVKKDNGKSAIAYTEIIPWTVEAIKQEKQTNDSLRYTLDSLRSAFQSIQNCLRTLCGDAPVHHNGGNGSSGDSNSAISNVQDVMLSGMANAPLLYQNIPNPFTTGTKINYFLPQGTVGATLVFYDTYGNQLKTVPLSQTGNGTLNITPDNLSSGIYSYSLIVNSNVVDTKRMILQK